MAERAGCHGCDNAQWDADGCTCRIDGLLVWNPAKGCKYCIHDEKPETVSEDYERGFKDGLKSECLKELKPLMVELAKGCTEAIKGITPMLIDKAHLTIKHAVNRWIPCSERLPEDGQRVLICSKSKRLFDVVFKANAQMPSFDTKIFGKVYAWYCEDVIKWMPLPEPPEKE